MAKFWQHRNLECFSSTSKTYSKLRKYCVFQANRMVCKAGGTVPSARGSLCCSSGFYCTTEFLCSRWALARTWLPFHLPVCKVVIKVHNLQIVCFCKNVKLIPSILSSTCTVLCHWCQVWHTIQEYWTWDCLSIL